MFAANGFPFFFFLDLEVDLFTMDGNTPRGINAQTNLVAANSYEFDGTDIFFGFVKGDFDEIGTFSLSELESITGPMGLTIERDIYFTAKPLSKCK